MADKFEYSVIDELGKRDTVRAVFFDGTYESYERIKEFLDYYPIEKRTHAWATVTRGWLVFLSLVIVMPNLPKDRNYFVGKDSWIIDRLRPREDPYSPIDFLIESEDVVKVSAPLMEFGVA